MNKYISISILFLFVIFSFFSFQNTASAYSSASCGTGNWDGCNADPRVNGGSGCASGSNPRYTGNAITDCYNDGFTAVCRDPFADAGGSGFCVDLNHNLNVCGLAGGGYCQPIVGGSGCTIPGDLCYGQSSCCGTGGGGTPGSCGTANGTTVSSAPTTNLCSSGTATAVSGSGPWTWSCNSTDGGTNASCSANKTGACTVAGSASEYPNGGYVGNPVTAGNYFTLTCYWNFVVPAVTTPQGCTYYGFDSMSNYFHCNTGSSTIFPIGGPYTVTCHATTNTSLCDASTQVTVIGPIASLTVNTAFGSASNGNAVYTYAGNDTPTLTWTSSNTTSCTVTSNNGDNKSGLNGTNVTANSLGNDSGSGKTWTYTLNCTGAGGNVIKTASVLIPPAPTNVTAVCPAPGTSAGFAWTAPVGYTNFYVRNIDLASPAVYVYGNDNYVGTTYTVPNAYVGSYTLVNPIANHNYSMWVHTKVPNGAWSTSVGVKYTCLPPAPTVTISASPITGTSPLTSTLSWTVAGNATSCTASNGWSGAKTFANGTNTQVISGITAGTTYTITCTNAGGNSTASSATVTPVGAITVNISATPPGPLTAPGSTTLTWTTTGNPDSCTASNFWSGSKVASGGSELRSAIPASTQIFTITCSKAGTTDATATVNVVVTSATTAPTLGLPTATAITTTTATLGATITSDGGASITARGTCWGTTPSPSTNCTAEGGTSTGIYTQARNGFSAGRTYYYRGFATNSVSIGYSIDGTFTTTSSAPVITSFNATTPISSGGSSTLTWTSTGATSCAISGGGTWNGLGTSGSQVTGSLVNSTSYKLVCTESGIDSAPKTVFVTVSPSTFSITVQKTVGGSVKSSDGGINCGATCSHSYTSGSPVTLTAQPDSSSWKFVGWADDCTGSGACILTVNGSKLVKAIFIPMPSIYQEF